MLKFPGSANWNPSLSLKFSKIFTRISFFIILLFSPASSEQWSVLRNISYLLSVALSNRKVIQLLDCLPKVTIRLESFCFCFFRGECSSGGGINLSICLILKILVTAPVWIDVTSPAWSAQVTVSWFVTVAERPGQSLRRWWGYY